MPKAIKKIGKVFSYIGNSTIIWKVQLKHIALTAFVVFAFNQFTSNEHKDGIWLAYVKYTNLQSGKRSDYNLNVRLKNDHVVAIYFPKKGSIHSGPNNSGYTYSGGEMKKVGGSLYAAEVILTNAAGSSFRYYVSPTYFGWE